MSVRMVISFPSKSPEKKREARRKTWAWKKRQSDLLYRARHEGYAAPEKLRKEYELPDWTVG